MKVNILAFGAHPDDVELGCASTLAKEISLGKTVGIIDLTQGELGTRGTSETRAKEAQKAAEILQVSFRENLNFRDGFFINDEKHQLEIIKKIRQYQPDIVICNAKTDRHIDHGKGSKLVADACFLSGLLKIETFLEGNKQQPWRPKNIFHYMQWNMDLPDFVVDVTGFLNKKIESVLAYDSQFYNAQSKEPETPITSKNFLDSITYRAQDLGRIIGVEHAEGFTIERIIGTKSLTEII
jgi:bacillithiol biosynthesis deacetylase BshB1